MTTTASTPSRSIHPAKFHDAAEWLHALGDIPLDRIVMDPWPGTATEQDLLRLVEKDKRLVELIDGTLVEKPVGWLESRIALQLATALLNFITPRKLGYLSGADGTLRVKSGRIRLPDLAFVSVDDLPQGQMPTESIPMLPFRLAVEVVSEANTRAEMRQKMNEYFESGTKLVWLVFPKTRTVEIYEQPSDQPARTLAASDNLDGGPVLKGFVVPIHELFDAIT